VARGLARQAIPGRGGDVTEQKRAVVVLVNTAQELAEALREHVPIIVIQGAVQVDALFPKAATSEDRERRNR
jgi:hypothetical protein